MARIVQSKFVYTRVAGSTFFVEIDKNPTPGNTLIVINFGNNNSNISVGLPTSPAGWTQDGFQFQTGGEAAAIVVGHRLVQAGDGRGLTFSGTSQFPQDSFVGVWEIPGAPAITAAAGTDTTSPAGAIATNAITPSGLPIGDVVFAGLGVASTVNWGPFSPNPPYSLLGEGTDPAGIAHSTDGAMFETEGTGLPTGKVSSAYTLTGGSGVKFWAYATAAVADPNAPKYLPYLRIPSGESQDINELDGHSSIGTIDAEAVDPTGDIRKLLLRAGVTGARVRFCQGFPGMPLGSFQTLHTMQLIALDRSPQGIMRFHLQDPQRFLMKQLWLNGGGLLPTAPPPPVRRAVRQHQVTFGIPRGSTFADNGQPVSDTNPRYLRGNPIDILLTACQNELGLGQGSTDTSSWRIYSPGTDSSLINPSRDLDVPGAIALRDGQFNGVWFEFEITSAQDGKQWIEDQILKPLGLYWIVTASGQLRLKSMKQPASITPFALNDNNIIGTPDTEFLPIINVVQVTPGTDDGSQADIIEFVDEASDAQFDQQYEQDVQADGLRYGRGAFLMGSLLADKMFRRHAGANGQAVPVYSLKTHLSGVKIEAGDFVSLTHRLLLDYTTGLIGVTNILCEVLDRNPDYQTASAGNELKVADTRFMKFSAGPFDIAPLGTPVWTSATADQKAKYLFISGSSGLMSDGTPGGVIF